MSGAAPINPNRLPPNPPLDPNQVAGNANSPCLKTAATVAIIAIGIITSAASFFLLPIAGALLSTGIIVILAIAGLACLSRCLPNSTGPVEHRHPTPPLPNLLGRIPVLPPVIALPPVPVAVRDTHHHHHDVVHPRPFPAHDHAGQGQVPRVPVIAVPQVPAQTVHVGQGHITPTPAMRVPQIPAQTVHVGQGHITPTPAMRVPQVPGQTVHVGQGHITPIPAIRTPQVPAQTVHVGQGHFTPVPVIPLPQVLAQPTPVPVIGLNPAIVQPRVVNAPPHLPPPDSGRGGTIQLGLGSHQPVEGPRVPLGRSSISLGGLNPLPRVLSQPDSLPPRREVELPPRVVASGPAPTTGGTIRPGMGSQQPVEGPRVPLGRPTSFPGGTNPPPRVAPQPIATTLQRDTMSTRVDPPRAAPTTGGSVRIGMGSNQPVGGPTIGLGSRGTGR